MKVSFYTVTVSYNVQVSTFSCRISRRLFLSCLLSLDRFSASFFLRAIGIVIFLVSKLVTIRYNL